MAAASEWPPTERSLYIDFRKKFAWLEDYELGELPILWNWLVGEYICNLNAHLLHFTLGTPCHTAHQNTPEAKLWLREREEMLRLRTTA